MEVHGYLSLACFEDHRVGNCSSMRLVDLGKITRRGHNSVGVLGYHYLSTHCSNY